MRLSNVRDSMFDVCLRVRNDIVVEVKADPTIYMPKISEGIPQNDIPLKVRGDSCLHP